jgi:nucleotide-binding universal stress UspA family protein
MATPRGHHERRLRVLAGVDGSAESTAALAGAVELLGDKLGHLTIAVVLDYDGDLSNVPGAEQERADDVLRVNVERVSALVATAPDAVVLVGRPADALVKHARDTACDVIVVGPRGHGASQWLFGSVASHMARGVGIPVMIMPPVHHVATPEPSRP